MKRRTNVLLAMLFGLGVCSLVQAAPIIGNFQTAFRMEGADLDFTADLSAWDGGAAVAPSFSNPGADFMEFGALGGGGGTGLGTMVFELTRGVGAVGTVFGSFHGFFDLEIDETINTFFNEEAALFNIGDLGVGVNPNAYEVDEPGFLFGDIPFNFESGDLDNSNALPVGSPDDVSVALGWENFELEEGEKALLTLEVSDTGAVAPGSSFAIQHIDPLSNALITFSGALEIIGSQPPPPPPPPPLPIVDVYFDPATQTVKEGDTFTVGLFADIPDPVFAWGLDLNFDSTILSLEDVVVDLVWGDLIPSSDGDGLAGASLASPISGTHIPLAELTFKALKEGMTDLMAGVTVSDLDEGFLLVPTGHADVNFSPGLVNVEKKVIGPPVIPEPTTLWLCVVFLSGLILIRQYVKTPSMQKAKPRSLY